MQARLYLAIQIYKTIVRQRVWAGSACMSEEISEHAVTEKTRTEQPSEQGCHDQVVDNK